MSYRADADALAARRATLLTEVARKQRELADVSAMLAEVREVEQAETYFEQAPARGRRQMRNVMAASLGALLLSGGLLGAAVATAAAPQEARAEAVGLRVRSTPTRITPEGLERRKAEVEALRTLGLIPIVAPCKGEAAPGAPRDLFASIDDLRSNSLCLGRYEPADRQLRVKTSGSVTRLAPR